MQQLQGLEEETNMAFVLPISSDPDNIQRIQLSTTTYDFRFRWNSYEECWYCYIGLNGADPKVHFKLVVGMDLLEQYNGYQEVPDGLMYLVDVDQKWGRPGRDNVGIGKRFQLFYAERDEDLSELTGDV